MLRHVDLSAGVWQGLIDATLKASFILVVAIFAAVGMRKAAPRHRYAVLTIAVFGVLIVPLLSSVMPRYRVPLLPEPESAARRAAALRDRALTVVEDSLVRPIDRDVTRQPTADIGVADAAHAGETIEYVAAEPQADIAQPSATRASRLAVSDDPTTSKVAAAARLEFPETNPSIWRDFDPNAAVIVVWLVGLVAGLAWMMLGTMRVNRWMRRGTLIDDSESRRIVRQVAQGLGLRRQIALLETDAIDSPITWGALRPVVLLPSNWREWPIDRLRIVLLHELTHVRRHDWLVQMSSRLACVVHWFNPLVWFVARRLEEVRELACDDDVVRIGTRPSTYAETLLDIATKMRRRPMVAAVALNMAARTRLEGRLISILGHGGGKPRRGFAMHGTLLAVMGSVLAMSAIEPWQEQRIENMARMGIAPIDDDSLAFNDAPSAPASDVASMMQRPPQLAAGVRTWKDRFRTETNAIDRETSSSIETVMLASTADRLTEIPALLAMAAPDEAGKSSGRLLDQASRDRQLLWDKAKASYRDDEQIVRLAVLSGDFDAAMRAVDRANQVLETARVYASDASEVDEYRRRAAALRTYVADEARRFAEESVREKLKEINERETVRLAAMADSRRRRVEELMTRAETLNGEHRYEEAIQVLEQLIASDPQNERANWLLRLLHDVHASRRDRAVVAMRDDEARDVYIGLDEDGIPYGANLRYPHDWVQKSARRRSTEEARESEDTRMAHARMRTRAPEIRFDGVTFEDVVDRLRTLTGLNIVPNWAAMEAVAIEKDAEVSLVLSDVTYDKTLELVLSEVGGGEVELGYEIDEGIVRISTKEDLSRRTSFVSYDIHDLIVSIPDFRGPEIDISNAGQNQNQQGGLAGGRFVGQGGGGLGGGGGAGGGGAGGNLFEDGDQEDEEQDAEDAIQPLIDLIQQTIEPESWRESGGNVGSISALNQQLIVTQTSTAHAQLRDLLRRR